MTWETSYGLPGEGLPPRVQADIHLNWPTWAQSAYRSWYIGESSDEQTPHRDRDRRADFQRLVKPPDLDSVLAVLPERSPAVGDDPLERSGPTVETVYPQAIDTPEYAIEVSYEGAYEFDDGTLEDGSILDDHFSGMGGWVSSTLVRVGDLDFECHPPVED
ncbi:MAG: hypothetical protein U5R31_01910 [Acidimicrobiia bacterium]|nr:hypothetical protein [Acidimicrobiia bacterium]